MTSTRFWRPADLGKHKGLGEVFNLTRSWNLVSVVLRDRSLFTAWGKGGRRIFVATTEHLRDPPLKHTVWFWSPHIGGGRFHDPTSSIRATTKSQCYYMQASDMYINTYVSWTLNNNFTYLVIWYELNCLWRVTLLKQIVENKVIVALVLHNLEFFLILFILWFPVTFPVFDTTRFVCVHRLFDVSVIMTSNCFYFVKLSINSGQSVFVQVEVKFFSL